MIDKELGYYTVDSVEFDSKIRAFLYASENNKEVKWNFNNRAFRTHNWSVEPTETLDQLYDERSRNIRESYDYVIISYSGGSDSHNILMSFIRQGLFVDEIIINHTNKLTDKYTDLDPQNKTSKNAAAEWHLHAYPMLKEISKKIPKTKITILDMSDSLFESLESVGDASWILNKREQMNLVGMTRFNYVHFDSVRKNFDKGKKIGLVVGIEKPRTAIDNGNFYITFQDRPANVVTMAEYIKDYTNSKIELFYWSPDALKILSKQAHVIKKWLEAFPENQMLWKAWVPPETFRLVHERILRSLLYTTWDNSWYQVDKAVKDWYSEFDSWFYDHYSDSKAFHIWKEGIEYVDTNLINFTKKDNRGQSDGLTPFFHHYKIGPMKVLNL
jgi:hypothetical protein